MAFNDDKEQRAVVAKALGRQDFWKAAYLVSLGNGNGADYAISVADEALQTFDLKFGGDLCPTTSST